MLQESDHCADSFESDLRTGTLAMYTHDRNHHHMTGRGHGTTGGASGVPSSRPFLLVKSIGGRTESKIYSRPDSQMFVDANATHPVQCSCMAKRTFPNIQNSGNIFSAKTHLTSLHEYGDHPNREK